MFKSKLNVIEKAKGLAEVYKLAGFEPGQKGVEGC